jgi:chemotaxis protein MotB
MKNRSSNIPKWMTHFSYLAILLVSFLVLMLSFSQIDVIKYKKIAQTFEHILGNQQYTGQENQNLLTSSIILQEYSIDNNKTPIVVKTIANNSKAQFQDLNQTQAMASATNTLGNAISEQLTTEIESQIIDISANENTLIMRITEKYSFESGSSQIKPDLIPILNKISTFIAETPGNITVAGFTDDVPIQNSNFHDNWQLSCLRAYEILNVILNYKNNDPSRFTLVANAENRPLYSNNSIDNRNKNRRVEITLWQLPK